MPCASARALQLPLFVSDHAAVFVAWPPCLEQLAIQWAPITKGHPWQNLAESGFAVQRRMLDAYVVGCAQREHVYQQPARFVADYQFWGHWAHKRTDAQARVFYASPEVILAKHMGEPSSQPASSAFSGSVSAPEWCASIGRFGCTTSASLSTGGSGGRPSRCRSMMRCSGSSRLNPSWSRIRVSMTPCGGGSRLSRATAVSNTVRFKFCSWRSYPSS